MLILSRKAEQSVRISGEIEVKVLGVKGSTVRLGIVAPKDVKVVRDDAKRREAA